SGISADGVRIDPALQASAMARLLTTAQQPALRCDPLAHHYKVIGLEITNLGGAASYTPDLINLGPYFTREERLSTRNFVFDRVFVHPAEISSANLFPSTVERTSGRGMAVGVSE